MALHHELVSSADQINVVFPIEFLDDVDTKEVAGTTGTYHPPNDVVRIAPHKVCHGAIMGNFLLSVNHSDLIQSADRRRKSTVHAENLVINDSCQSQVVEDLRAVPPHVDRTVLTEALIVKPINLGNLSAFVVATDQRDAFGVPHLQG